MKHWRIVAADDGLACELARQAALPFPVARVLVAPAEMPVGGITALLGGPFFLWLLFRREAPDL